MASRALRRRSATAVGVYSATIFGFFISVAATRVLGPDDFARFAVVLAATNFFEMLTDLTVEEALVKFGFRYSESGDWGRLRRLFQLALGFKLLGGVAAAVAICALAPFAHLIWKEGQLTLPLLVAAFVPLVGSGEDVAGTAIVLRGRYDVRGFFQAVSMGLRLAGVVVGAFWGVVGAVSGLLVAQALATAAVSAGGWLAFRRFPQGQARPLGADRRQLARFVAWSSGASSVVAARTTLGTMLVGALTPIVQAGYFRNAQAPLTGMNALSSPVRLILLTEQTRDFEAGDSKRVWRLFRRYIAGATALMLVTVPPLWWAMPYLMGLVYGPEFRLHATNAARLILVAAAIQLIWGWSKSFPVSIGRPELRILAHGIELAVLVPLTVVFADEWGATGAAGAVLAATVAFAIVWTVLLLRLRGRIVLPAKPEPAPS